MVAEWGPKVGLTDHVLRHRSKLDVTYSVTFHVILRYTGMSQSIQLTKGITVTAEGVGAGGTRRGRPWCCPSCLSRWPSALTRRPPGLGHGVRTAACGQSSQPTQSHIHKLHTMHGYIHAGPHTKYIKIVLSLYSNSWSTSGHVNTSQRPSDARIRNSKFFSTRKYLKSGFDMTYIGIVELIDRFDYRIGQSPRPNLLVVRPDATVAAFVKWWPERWPGFEQGGGICSCWILNGIDWQGSNKQMSNSTACMVCLSLCCRSLMCVACSIGAALECARWRPWT